MADQLPTDIFYDILSRLPLKSLARFRCVSKQWYDYINHDDQFTIIHAQRSTEQPKPIIFHESLNIINFHIITQPKETPSIVLEAKHDPFLDVECKSSPCKCQTGVFKGSCNELVYLSRCCMSGTRYVFPRIVINPLKKECYKLPHVDITPSLRFGPSSYGLGFDASNNTFKMVFVSYKLHQKSRKNSKNIKEGFRSKRLYSMVHILGTDSWRKIAQVPPTPLEGDGVYAHGVLYWFALYHDLRRLVLFDVTNETFGMIHIPPETPNERRRMFHQLVNLHDEVGYAYKHDAGSRMVVWILKQKEWLIYCHFDLKPPHPNRYIDTEVIGPWNKEGDILMKIRNRWFVYRLKSDNLNEVYIVGLRDEYKPLIYMSPASSLFSIRGINTNAYSIKN